MAGLSGPFRRLAGVLRGDPSAASDLGGHRWALRDVSFDVAPGEILGVIGPNGAGKSTLLKILSRITVPTEGFAEVRGQVGSLLEVGTGFHPELTGRENVYLSGAVLGMRRHLIESLFEEIVAFAEVGEYIDTPVKHYSSGMYLRLAFAVAAHLEPDVLVVDEVLAVGDASFQRKCLGRMGAVAEGGRTVLFVSHDLQAIRRLCTRALLLDHGRVLTSGTPSAVIETYLGRVGMASPRADEARVFGPMTLRGVEIWQDGGPAGEVLAGERPFEVRILYDLSEPVPNFLLGFDVSALSGAHVFRAYDLDETGVGTRPAGRHRSIYTVPGGVLADGRFAVSLLAGSHRLRWLSREQVRRPFQIQNPRAVDVTLGGVLQAPGTWRVERR